MTVRAVFGPLSPSLRQSDGIEDLPLPDATADGIISDCLINLSADTDHVLAGTFGGLLGRTP